MASVIYQLGVKKTNNATILDSSFNPPTRAHYKMAQVAISTHSSKEPLTFILSISPTNVSKVIENEDLLSERLEWIKVIADDLYNEFANKIKDFAILVVLFADARLFFQKSSILAKHSIASPSRFLIGDDTFERIFQRSFYFCQDQELSSMFTEFFTRSTLLVFTRHNLKNTSVNVEWFLIQMLPDHAEELRWLKERIQFHEWADAFYRQISSTRAREFRSNSPSQLPKYVTDSIFEKYKQ